MLCSLRAYRRSSIRLRTVALSRPELGASKVHVPSLSVFYRDISSQKSPKNTEIVTKKAGTASIQNKAISLMKSTFDSVVYVCRNPGATWQHIKDEVKHYWLGTKLLWSDVKIAKQILTRLFLGHGMTRRERMQLIRTTTDIFRLVPFSIFIIVPFMELLLPFALKIFPNMLPSTFQDSLRKEESMKQELQMRLAVAKFMQETLQEMAEKKSSSVSDEASGAREVIDFIEQARLGSHIPNETVVRIARLFKDELTLANVPRPQLVSMCRYMGLPPYGGDAFLRFQLRSKFRVIQDDDRRILWEGIDTLNTLELRDACRDRGMRSLGIGQFRLRNQLQEWLDLSTLKSIPISLLIMSRALMLSTAAVEEGGQKGAGATTAAEEVLKSSMSSLDQGTINEVVLAAASPGEKDTPDIRKRMLESLEFQKEMIAGERLEAAEALIARHSIPGVSSVPPSAPQTITASVPPDSLDGFASATATVDQLATTSPIAGSGVLDVSASPADESPASAAGAASAASASGASSPTHTRPDAANCAAAGQPGATDTSAKTTLQQQQQQQQQQQKDASSAPNEQQARTAAASAGKEGELPSSSYEQPPVLPATAEQQELTVNELIALSDLARGSVLQREMSELAILEAYLESLPLDAEDSVEEQEAGGVPQQGAPTPEHSQQQHFQQPDTTVSSAAASGAADPPHDAPAGSTAGSTLTAPSYRLDPDAWVQNKTDKTPEKKAEKKVDKNVTRMRSAISSMLGKLKVQINTTEKALGDRLKLLDKDGDGQISAEEIKEVVSQVLKRGASATDGDGNQNAVEVQGLFDLIDSNKDGKVSLSELLQFIQKKRESMEVEALEARMRASQVQPQDPQQAPSAVTPAQRVEGCTATSAGSSHSSSSIPSQQLGSDSDTVKDTDTVSSPKT